ncbi:MAG: SDR family oxidoreductase [Rhodospirillales bacterium]|nr:SDR family oxidoreductase [Rhodospirillales bacterium]
MSTQDLAGTVALVMRASAGIGAALDEALAARGAMLAIAARRRAPLDALAERLGPNVLPLTCDVADQAAVAAAVAATVARFGRLDHLINNAGVIQPIGHLHETDPAEWARCIQVNLTGAFFACHAALPHLLERGGTIVNVSSGAGHRPLEGWSAYCSSKAGMVMLTRALLLEYGERGIRAYGFSPGTVRTDMQVAVRAAGMNPVSQLPIEALIPPAAPAGVIAWLCTPEAADVPGGECSIRDDELRRRAGVEVTFVG